MQRPTRRPPTPIPGQLLALSLILILTLILTLLAPRPALGAPAAEAPVPPGLRSAPPPLPLERARMERWHAAWNAEAGALARSFAAALEAAEPGAPGALRPHCVALAGALLRLDRERVLPVPDRPADLYLRAGLRHLSRAAVACLTKRPYAAVDALRRARASFRETGRVLRRYGLESHGPAASAAGR